MKQNPLEQPIDSIVERFNYSNRNTATTCERSYLTLWILRDRKADFEFLQRETRKQFGRDLTDLVNEVIDKAMQKYKSQAETA